MSAGLYPAGSGPAGFAPVAPLSSAPVPQPGVPLIHPGSHDAVPQDDGTLEAVHPVDQAVALALGIKAGTVGSATSIGNLLSDLEYASRTLEVLVRQRVDTALAQLTARGDVALVSVVTTRIPGGFTVDITYRNLRLLSSVDPKSVQLKST